MSLSGNYISMVFTGLLNNLLVMLLASIVPAGVGIGLTFLMKSVGTKGIRLPFRIIGAVFYSLAPITLLLVLFFWTFARSTLTMPSVVIALMISHLGYFAMHFDKDASVGKNIVVNTLGLLSSLFMWSMVSGYVGFNDVVHMGNQIRGISFDPGILSVVLMITFVVLAALNVPRMILKETMK